MRGLEIILFHGANEHTNNESFKNCSMETEIICVSKHLFSLISAWDKVMYYYWKNKPWHVSVHNHL